MTELKFDHASRLLPPVQLKNASVKADGSFEGYGSVFGVVDTYGDVVERGAFQKSLATHRDEGSMPAMLWQHDPREPVGVWSGMKEDDHGLAVSGHLNLDTQRGAEAHALLKQGALRGLSIGYKVPEGGYERDGSVYRLKEIELWEVSLVTFPANRAAQIRSAGELEQLLRDAGLAKKAAVRVVAGGFKALAKDDEDAELAQAVLDQIKSSNEALKTHLR